MKGHMDDSERLANSAEGLGCDSGRLASGANGASGAKGKFADRLSITSLETEE